MGLLPLLSVLNEPRTLQRDSHVPGTGHYIEVSRPMAPRGSTRQGIGERHGGQGHTAEAMVDSGRMNGQQSIMQRL